MNEGTLILISLFTPEIHYVLSLFFPDTRKWWIKMIENSDGDPHHTDGFFIVVLIGIVWCFRIAGILGLKETYQGGEHTQTIIAFLTAGLALLGVRIFRGKILFNDKEAKT